jgi:hypothetical protein
MEPRGSLKQEAGFGADGEIDGALSFAPGEEALSVVCGRLHTLDMVVDGND